MRVTEKDKSYFDRIGAIKAASHAAAQRENLARTLGERLERSWDLYVANRQFRGGERIDDPSPFYDRARALNLYRP